MTGVVTTPGPLSPEKQLQPDKNPKSLNLVGHAMNRKVIVRNWP
jgi:hypothetical protein